MKLLNIGERIRHIRKTKNLKQAEFARLINSTQNNIAKYENGYTEPNIDTLARIANVGNVSLDWLLTGEDKKRSQHVNFVHNNNYPSHNTIETDLVRSAAELLYRTLQSHNINFRPEQFSSTLVSVYELAKVAEMTRIDEKFILKALHIIHPERF